MNRSPTSRTATKRCDSKLSTHRDVLIHNHISRQSNNSNLESKAQKKYFKTSTYLMLNTLGLMASKLVKFFIGIWRSIKVSDGRSPHSQTKQLFSAQHVRHQPLRIIADGVDLDLKSLKKKLDVCQFNRMSSKKLDETNKKFSHHQYQKYLYIRSDITDLKQPRGLLDSLTDLLERVQQFRRSRTEEEDAVAIAKFKWYGIKCHSRSYCESNYEYCFDYYRCNDPMILKLVCYELYRELEKQDLANRQRIALNKTYMESPSQISSPTRDMRPVQVQRILFDMEMFLENINVQLKRSPQQNQHAIQTINDQIRRLRSEVSHQSQNYEYSRKISVESELDVQKNLLFRHDDQTTYEVSADKMISGRNKTNQNNPSEQSYYQTSNTAALSKMNSQLQLLYSEAAKRSQTAIEANKLAIKYKEELEIIQIDYKRQNQKLLEVTRTLEGLSIKYQDTVQENLELKKQNFEQTKEINDLKIKMELICTRQSNANKEELIELMKSLETKNNIIQELQGISAQNQNEIEKLNNMLEYRRIDYEKQIKENAEEINKISDLNLHQQRVLQSALKEAINMGKIALLSSEVIIKQSPESQPTSFVHIQKELFIKRPQIISKLSQLKRYLENPLDEYNEGDETHDISPFNQDVNIYQPTNQSLEPYFSGGISQINSPLENRSPCHRQQPNLYQQPQEVVCDEDLISMLLVQSQTIDNLLNK